MNQQQIEKRQKGKYGLIGDVHFDTAVSIESEGFQAIDESHASLEIDFSSAGACTSVILALMLSWLRYAKQQNKPLTFSGMSPLLVSQIEHAHLGPLISINS